MTELLNYLTVQIKHTTKNFTKAKINQTNYLFNYSVTNAHYHLLCFLNVSGMSGTVSVTCDCVCADWTLALGHGLDTDTISPTDT